MGKGVVLSNKGAWGGILFFRTHTSCNTNNYSSFKVMNVEWPENDHIKFGV